MSFILDALKKSENERQRTVGPSLADAPTRQLQAERPWWAIAVGALLIINLGVLIFVLTRKPAAPPAPASTTTAIAAPVQQPAAAAPAPVTSAAAPSRASSNPAVRSLAEEADAANSPYYDTLPTDTADVDPSHADLAAAANVPAGPPIVRPVQPPAVAPLNSQSYDDPNLRAGVANEVLPSANAIIAGGTNLPDMRLDIHVYSNKPAERFVFINMRKYTEGQTLLEGPTLERITPDGAILNRQGLRFVLSRQ